MRRLDLLLLAALVLLAFSAAALTRDIAWRMERGGAGRLELGREKRTRLEPETIQALQRLSRPLRLTYYVSPAARMPTEMRRMALEVTDLLDALAARFPERVDTLVLDPQEEIEGFEDLEGFAARQRVAPFRVRSVTRDAWDERTVWSTLVLSIEGGPEARIASLRPEHLGSLQGLIVEWLRELAEPRAPRIALAAPPGFDELEEELAARGELLRVDLDHGQPLPEAELLFWMRPARAEASSLRELERFLAAGGSVVLADAQWNVREEQVADGWRWSFEPSGTRLPAIAAHFGLRWEGGGELLCDATSQTLETEEGTLAFPHRIRCIAPNQDFRTFEQQPNGTLVFVAAAPLLPEATRLRELGRRAQVLASSSDHSWLQPFPEEPGATETTVPARALRIEDGQPVAKQALLVALRPDDTWQGELFLASSDSPFADGMLRMPNAAHRRLLDTLVARTASAERRVISRRVAHTPEPLAEISAAARLGWRAFVLGLPLLALLYPVTQALLAHSSGRESETKEHPGESFHRRRAAIPPHSSMWRPWRRPAALGLMGSAVVFGLARTGWRSDWRMDGERLDPLTRGLVQRGVARGTLVLSRQQSLPPALRGPAQELSSLLDDLRRAGLELDLQRITPEDLDQELADFPAFEAATSDEEVTRVARFYATLRLTHGDHTVSLDFPDVQSFERLEFRLSQGLASLQGTGPGTSSDFAFAGDTHARPVHVAFASDLPRLSAAEAYEQYQEKGLFAPSGGDIYSLARASLERNDLLVTHVNPREPVLPAGTDVLIWLQPRRSIEPMLEEVVRFLVGGGRVILAAQHFSIQAQQFRGGNFAPRYWPRPQTPDVETLYFPQLSIELVREVLFDRLALPIEVDAEVTGRRGGRDVERQVSALPFQIRASASGFADAPLTRRLGDQAFLGANRLRWDDAVLARLGLCATPLIATSSEAWSFAWKGGWIPDELLAGPSTPEGSSGPTPLGPQALAVLFEGSFPRPEKPLRLEEWTSRQEEGNVVPQDATLAGETALAGEATRAGSPDAATASGETASGRGSLDPGAHEDSLGAQVTSDREVPGGTGLARSETGESLHPGDAMAPAERPAAAPSREWPEPAPGKLLFLGASTPFQDEHLRSPIFRGDHLLWNAVATMAFAPEWIPLATRSRSERGFGYVAPRTRLRWRVVAIGGAPLALLALAGAAVFVRARPPARRLSPDRTLP